MPTNKPKKLSNFALSLKTYDTHNTNKYSAQSIRKFPRKV